MFAVLKLIWQITCCGHPNGNASLPKLCFPAVCPSIILRPSSLVMTPLGRSGATPTSYGSQLTGWQTS